MDQHLEKQKMDTYTFLNSRGSDKIPVAIKVYILLFKAFS